MKEGGEIKCPICGEGTFPEGTWKDGGYHNLRVRATWAAHPYIKKENAWVYGSHKDDTLYPHHGVVSAVSFGRCGYQEIELGLTLVLKLETGGCVCWTFYNYGDIAEFFERAKASELDKLVGTPIIAFFPNKGWGGSIMGIDIIDNMVLR